MTDIYWMLFLHCIEYGTMIVGHNDIAYFAMRDSGGYDMKLATAIAIAGTTIGNSLNIFAGMLALYLVKRFYGPPHEVIYGKICYYYNTYFIYLLLISFVWPFYLLALASGAFRSKIWLSVLLIAAGRTYFYVHELILHL